MRYVICAYVHKIKNIRIEVAGLDVLAFEVCRRRRLAHGIQVPGTVRYNVQHQNSYVILYLPVLPRAGGRAKPHEIRHLP